MPPEEPSQTPQQPVDQPQPMVDPNAGASQPPVAPVQPPLPPQPMQQPVAPGYPQQPMGQPAAQPHDSNLLGILGIVFAFVFWPAGLVCSILAMKKSGTSKTLGIVGLILNGIMLLLSILFILLTVTAVNGVQHKAQDVKYTTDLRAIRLNLETVYANDSAYPGLDQLNSETWRSTHMTSLSVDALSPNSSQTQLVSGSPTDSAYSYTPSPAGCEDSTTNPCTSYVLSAKQNSGGLYTLKSLNY